MRQTSGIIMQPSPPAAPLDHSQIGVDGGHEPSANAMTAVTPVPATTVHFKKRYLMKNPPVVSAPPPLSLSNCCSGADSRLTESPKQQLHRPETPNPPATGMTEFQSGGESRLSIISDSERLWDSREARSKWPHISHAACPIDPVMSLSTVVNPSSVTDSAQRIYSQTPRARVSTTPSCLQTICSAASPCCDKPLNLSTAVSSATDTESSATKHVVREMYLSSLVEHMVEKMLTTRDESDAKCDDVTASDSLGSWFNRQYESLRSDGRTVSSSESACQRASTAPWALTQGTQSSTQKVSSPPNSSAGSTVTDLCDDKFDTVAKVPVHRTLKKIAPPTVELTIGMSDTINHVIDSIYRQEPENSETKIGASDSAVGCHSNVCNSAVDQLATNGSGDVEMVSVDDNCLRNSRNCGAGSSSSSSNSSSNSSSSSSSKCQVNTVFSDSSSSLLRLSPLPRIVTLGAESTTEPIVRPVSSGQSDRTAPHFATTESSTAEGIDKRPTSQSSTITEGQTSQNKVQKSDGKSRPCSNSSSFPSSTVRRHRKRQFTTLVSK